MTCRKDPALYAALLEESSTHCGPPHITRSYHPLMRKETMLNRSNAELGNQYLYENDGSAKAERNAKKAGQISREDNRDLP